MKPLKDISATFYRLLGISDKVGFVVTTPEDIVGFSINLVLHSFFQCTLLFEESNWKPQDTSSRVCSISPSPNFKPLRKPSFSKWFLKAGSGTASLLLLSLFSVRICGTVCCLHKSFLIDELWKPRNMDRWHKEGLIEYCLNRIYVCTCAFTPSLSAILPVPNPSNRSPSSFIFVSCSCSLFRLSKCSRRHHKIGMLNIGLKCSVWQLYCNNTDACHVLMELLRQCYAPGLHGKKHFPGNSVILLC